MSGVSKEQIERAKSIAILDYVLSHEPNNVRRVGNEYRLKDHDTLTMSNGCWHWHSQGIGGRTATALNYLIEVRGYSFVDAVRHLAGEDYYIQPVPKKAIPPPAANTKSPERKPFTLPPKSRSNNRVIAYLQNRGIPKPLILDCIKRGELYESADYGNCVFIGKDEHGEARFASIRGTLGNFKRDADGSDKCFGFKLPPKNPATQSVAVFEAPVDAFSHQVLEPDFTGWRLSLGGTALAALTHFLESHPEIRQCVVCTDNDEAGNIAAAKVEGLTEITAVRSLPPSGKDWNDALMAVRQSERQVSYSLSVHQKSGDALCL